MRPRILFVGTRDGGRSRMAAAFLDHLAGERYDAVSAGTQPAARIHPEVAAAMAEEGVAMPDGPGTQLTAGLAASADRIVGIGCAVADACPGLPVPLEDWGLPDPEGRHPDEVRVIRDATRRLVTRLIARLDTEAAVH